MSRVAIIDDHPAFSERLGAFVNALPGWSVVGAVEDAIAGLELVLATRPDVALVDIGLPAQNGFWFTERALGTIPQLRVILMSDAEPEEYAEAATQTGAFAYVPKHAISRDLPALLRGATGGGPGAGGGPQGGVLGPGPGVVNVGRSTGPATSATAPMLQRSALSWTPLIVAGAAFLAFVGSGELTLGLAVAVALLSLHRQWPPPRARRGRAGERGLQRSDLDR